MISLYVKIGITCFACDEYTPAIRVMKFENGI